MTRQSERMTGLFKSFVSYIRTQEDVDAALGYPFSLMHPFYFQPLFDKHTSPWEIKDWVYEDLINFTIKAEKIDRLYHMVVDDASWEIFCRVEYKGKLYFSVMYASCNDSASECPVGGYIAITKLPNFFLQSIVTPSQNPEQIYKSLIEDGYIVDEPQSKLWNNAPKLKYLCYDVIYKHRTALPCCKTMLFHPSQEPVKLLNYYCGLPKTLLNSVNNFIIAKDWENKKNWSTCYF